MKAIWKGALAFGLLNVPVRVYAATEDHDISFHQVHAVDGGRIRYKRVCTVDGEEVPYGEIAKGYETSDGSTVILTDEDLDALKPASSKEMAVVEFVPAEQVDPILFDRSYYLEPEPTAVKAYQLLLDTLRAQERTAIAQVTLRQRTRLAALRASGDVLVMQTLHWRDEIRNPGFGTLTERVEIKDAERKAASALVEALASDFEPEAFTDEYKERVVGVLEGKIERGDVLQAQVEEDTDTGAQVVDLLAALQASVDRAAKAGGAPSGKERPMKAVPGTKKPARKKTAKKTAAAPKERSA